MSEFSFSRYLPSVWEQQQQIQTAFTKKLRAD